MANRHEHPGEHILPTSDAERIEYIGINDISDEERFALEEVARSYHERIRRKVRNDVSLMVHLKMHGTMMQSKRNKMSVHLRVVAATRHFETEATDFDIRKAAHMAFDGLLHEIEHYYHEEAGVARKMLSPRG